MAWFKIKIYLGYYLQETDEFLFKMNIAAKSLSARKKCQNNGHFEFKNHTTAKKSKTFVWFLYEIPQF